jgi:hypothetical protein
LIGRVLIGAVGAMSLFACKALSIESEYQDVGGIIYSIPPRFVDWYNPGKSFILDIDLRGRPTLARFGSVHDLWMSWGRSSDSFVPAGPEALASSIAENDRIHGLEIRRITLLDSIRDHRNNSNIGVLSYAAKLNDSLIYVQCGEQMCLSSLPLRDQSIFLMFSPRLMDWSRVFACAYYLEKSLRKSSSGSTVDGDGRLANPGPCGGFDAH